MIIIKGKAKYINLETGFWGIEEQSGKKYLPVNMPEQLKMNGANVECSAILSSQESFFQWGTTIEIVSFKTITP